MSNYMTRRKAIAAGAASAGIVMKTACSKTPGKAEKPQKKEIPFSEKSWWPPGPDRDLVRDLKPGHTPVRLACMTAKTMLNYPEKASITEAVKRIRDEGYTSANACYGLNSRNKWLDASESEVAELKEALKKYDVELFDMMIWTNLIDPDEKKRQKSLKYAAENVEAADRVGCRMVTAVTGSRDPDDNWIAMHHDNWTRETWEISIDSIHQILRDTAGCKTALGIEAAITTNIDGPQAHKRIMEGVGDPRCKVCLDPTNMMSIARYYHSYELLNECFDLLGEDILGCHAKDTFILKNKMLAYITQVPPGQGVQDYEAYLVLLSRLKWPRTLMLEHLKPEDYPPAKAFIEKTAKKVGVKIYS